MDRARASQQREEFTIVGGAPSTVAQLTLLVLVILPGVTYQILREQQRGPVPGERDVSERILRALVASVALDSLYVLAFGPQLAHVFGHHPSFAQARTHIRLAGLICLVLVFIVPAAAALTLSRIESGQRQSRYLKTPTAWDHLFRGLDPCFVRVRLKGGTWVGGWYGTKSFASSYPQSHEIFLELEWRMDSNGVFLSQVTKTGGIYLRADDIDMLEIIEN